MILRSEANLSAIEAWAARAGWVGFLAADKRYRSCTSVCLKIVDPMVAGMKPDDRAAYPRRMVALLDAERIAYDIDAYRDAPPGLRIWAGATVERRDSEALRPWRDWAFAVVKDEIAAKA